MKSIPYISIKQVAAELGCSSQHVRNVVKENGLDVYLFGQTKQLLRVKDVIRLIEENRKAATIERLTAFH